MVRVDGNFKLFKKATNFPLKIFPEMEKFLDLIFEPVKIENTIIGENKLALSPGATATQLKTKIPSA